MTTTRAQRVDALERWADEVNADDLVEAKTAPLRTIAELVEQRDGIDTALLDAIRESVRPLSEPAITAGHGRIAHS